MSRVKFFTVCALAAFVATASAELEPEQAERAVETRQSLLHLMGWNIGPLGAMARDRIEFDAERVATNAQRLQALSKMLSDAFAPDTRGNDVTTEALDAIWEQPEDFAAKIEANMEAADNLVAATQTGDEAAMREAIGRLGSTCGSCHDDFASTTKRCRSEMPSGWSGTGRSGCGIGCSPSPCSARGSPASGAATTGASGISGSARVRSAC